jgi:hypothetical protein
MGELAAELLVNAKDADGKLCFAVFHLTKPEKALLRSLAR